MIARDDVLLLYRLVLDREPESEEVINEKRRSSGIADVAFEMLMSEEFIKKNATLLKQVIGA